jgi:hypothetical protein
VYFAKSIDIDSEVEYVRLSPPVPAFKKWLGIRKTRATS